MKILSIKFNNLASIEGTYEIDFTQEPLASAGIFAISGTTGAGKSTVLDALCLALYDKTPRFSVPSENLFLQDVGDNQIDQSDVRNILRRGTGSGFAEVKFEAVDGHHYRSRWSVKRLDDNPTGTLMPQTMELFNHDTGEEILGNNDELLGRIFRLVGLTYEQFTRTVLLAQNDFATFLKSRESQKAELLEKLTGTEYYSQISRAVFIRNKSAHAEINFLKQNIKQIELIPEEELTQMSIEREQLIPQREYASRQLLVLNEQLRIINVYNQQTKLLAEKQKEYQNLKEDFDAIFQRKDAQQQDYVEFREYMNSLEPELNKARELDIQIQNTEDKIQQQRNICLTASRKRKEMEKTVSDKELVFAKELTWINNEPLSETNELRLKDLQTRVVKEKATLQAMLAENEDRIEQLNEYSVNKLSEELHAIATEQQRLQEARIKTMVWIGLKKEEERLANELADNKALLIKKEKELVSFRQQLEAKSERVKTLEKLCNTARVTMCKDVKSLRDNLPVGDPCPVCGSTSHPYQPDDNKPNTLYANIEQEYKTHLEDYRQTADQCLIKARDVQNLQELSHTLAERIEKLQIEIKDTCPGSEAEQTIKHFDTALQKLVVRQENLLKQLNRYQELYNKWQLVEEDVKKQRILFDTLKDTLNSCQLLLQHVNSEKEQLALMAEKEVEDDFRLAALEKELDLLKAERATLLNGDIVQEAIVSFQHKENQLLSQLELTTKELDKCNTAILLLEGELKQLTITVEALELESRAIENVSALPRIIAEQKILIEKLDKRYSFIEAKQAQQHDNKLKYHKLKADIERKQKTVDKWEKLNWLIGSSDGAKFKIIAQSYTLNLLLLHANKHLSYLSKRYKLQQVPDTLALQVIDCEMCNEVRTIYSLSGGESFLISLALALGLSSLSSNNLKVESLFIDEGFGSLDGDSLRTAMKALEQLYFTGRKIGVISHVEEMTERIPVKIHVEKGVNGRSRIDIRRS
ncbi:AAA family ATPase [Bacteroides sp. OttesenSCG-928-D19]|nr:AAA family ATPase [Bacteroides sp. OttesenSCG-928-N06]MDL2305215.1 AAA family ATPase [Bacteroides sp. OttesenSCG-928-D19]